MTDLLHRATELTTQGASDSSGPLARAAAAAEIDQIIEALKAEGNASYGGRYIFAGTATKTQPYLTGATDTYQVAAADRVAMPREIGPGVSVNINVIGHDLLGDGQAAGDDKLLDVLRDVAQHLRGGTAADANALRGTDLARLESNLDLIVKARATVGATTNRLEASLDRLAELEETSAELLSINEDADMAKTMIDLSMQQAVYQSALKAGANIVQASLLDFLR